MVSEALVILSFADCIVKIIAAPMAQEESFLRTLPRLEEPRKRVLLAKNGR